MKMTESEIMVWNARHPEGSPCWLLLDDGNLLETKTRSQAWLLGNGAPVAKVEGKTGGWLLERVFFGTQEQAAAKIVDLLGLGVPKVLRPQPPALPLGTLEPQPNEMVVGMLRDAQETRESDVVCPHCGWRDAALADLWNTLGDRGDKHVLCHGCQQEFEARRHVSIEFSTRKI